MSKSRKIFANEVNDEMSMVDFINEYRKIIAFDGEITKDYLINNMLKLDEGLSDSYKTDEKLDKLADEILEKKYGRKDYAIGPEKQALYDERMKLYQQGLSDVEIAKIQNINRTSITSWREKRNLKSNTLSNKEKNKIRMDLYLKGYTNKQIAEAENAPLSTIGSWVYKRKLKPNGYTEPLKERYKKANREDKNV